MVQSKNAYFTQASEAIIVYCYFVQIWPYAIYMTSNPSYDSKLSVTENIVYKNTALNIYKRLLVGPFESQLLSLFISTFDITWHRGQKLNLYRTKEKSTFS